MIAVHFDKAFAESVADALNSGKPIQAPAPGWNGNYMLMLAGMLSAGVYSQGPHAHQVAGITPELKAKLPQEHQEAIEDTFRQDIHDGLEFVGTLFFEIIDGSYDQHFEPNLRAVVYREGDEKCVLPCNGFNGVRNFLSK